MSSGDSAYRSSALLIWFQDHFGMPTQHTIAQIRDLDWEAHSWNRSLSALLALRAGMTPNKALQPTSLLASLRQNRG